MSPPKKETISIGNASFTNHWFSGKMRSRLANSPSKYINYEVQRCFTLPKSDVAPENRPLKRRFLLETTIFRCYVSFREGCVFLFFLARAFLGDMIPNLMNIVFFNWVVQAGYLLESKPGGSILDRRYGLDLPPHPGFQWQIKVS